MGDGGAGGVLRRFFTPPRLLATADAARGRMVYWMAGTIALSTTASQLTLMALVPAEWPRFLAIMLLVWAICLGDLVFVYRGRVAAAGWFQTIAVWALLTTAAATTGGVSGQTITGQLLVVALGGLLVGWRGGLGFAVLALATVVALAVTETVGVLPEPGYAQTPATRAVTLATYIVVLAVVQVLVMRNLQGARDSALQELREREAAESFSDLLVESAPAIFFVIDAQGRRLRWNKRYEELMGMATEEFSRLELLGTIVAEDRPAVARKIAEAFASGSAELVARVGRGPSARDVLLTGRRVELDGTPCVAGFGLDVTDLKHAEAEVHALNEDLEARVGERTAQLEEALRALESFSYSVSHDLRAPLRAINGYATIIETDYGASFDEEGRRQLERIRENTERMAQLIDDLLRFSRLGRQQLVRERVDMHGLAQAVFDEVVTPGQRAVVKFEIAPLPDAWGDAGMLRQVWVNLFENALKFSRDRERPSIAVESGSGDAGPVYLVRDNGVGFDDRYSGRLFSVFERLHGNEYEGTGIGLAICKRIVEAHGGQMWCESSPGAGSTFSFMLPEGDQSPGDPEAAG